MADRVCLITGGSAGIGEALCRSLLAEGAQVINLDAQPPRIEHERLHFHPVDLTDATATRAAAEAVTGRYPVTELVNNAGATRPGRVETASLEDLDHVVRLHLAASLILTQAVLPAMKQAHYGRIVNVSTRAVLGKPERSVYAATKAGLLGFTRTWAMELGEHGITVNAVAPGPIATELFVRSNPQDSPQTRRIVESILVKRLGSPEDVARAVMFFLAAESGFITGQVLYVCGGTTLGTAPL
jgi:NAD(P)-dependent dehydrogenase (short-subunit alcohol dehydrogenase family)